MKVRALPVAIALALVVPLSAVAPSAAEPHRSDRAERTVTRTAAYAPTSKPAAKREKRYVRKVRVHTNRARKRHDLKRVRTNRCVDRFANKWARKMARRQNLEHQNLTRVMRRCDLTMVGENIAYGYRSGKAVVRGWMRSEGHRANILTGRYRLMGVGMKRDNRGRAWVSQVFARR